MSKPKSIIRTKEGTRVGVLEANTSATVFVWVGRGDDSDDDERVAELSKRETVRLIRLLTEALATCGEDSP